MNANELRPLLVEYRNQVEQAWTPETGHPDFHGRAGQPYGQCGSTSVWLKRRLHEDHGLKTHFAEGSLFARGDIIRRHCWLETEDYRLVLDLTADQLAIDHRVVCETHWNAWSFGLQYIGVRYLTDLSHDPDLLRRANLLQGVSA